LFREAHLVTEPLRDVRKRRFHPSRQFGHRVAPSDRRSHDAITPAHLD
jgi:hypothetical protein